MLDLAPAPVAAGLAEILAERGDPMAAAEAPWLDRFRIVPGDAAPPLAMSGPHPRAVGSYGADCIEWAEREFGVTPRWWQALAITRQLEHDAAGDLVWREVIESGPRRIGKSVRLRIVALWRLANAHRIGEKQLAMLVSKDLAVGKEIHRGAWRWAESKDWKVVRLNGGQEVEAPDESRWLLRADTAVYGYDVGYGQVDESWGVDPQSITDGLEPALLERLWPQLHLTSTAHVKATSLMRRRLVAALRNADPNVLLLLWGPRPGVDVADEATWRAASPHWSEARRELIARKYAAALAGQDDPEIDDPDPVRGWAAQYLNVWPLLFGEDASCVLPGWDRLAVSSPSDPVPAGLGVANDPSQTWLSLGAALEGAPRHLAVVDRRRVNELGEFVANVARIQQERGCPVAVRAKNFMIPSLITAGCELTVVDSDDRAQAHADLAGSVQRGEVVHGDYPELNAAVAVADWRTYDNRRYFDASRSDISALEAAALAAWAAENVSTGPNLW